MTDFNLYFYYKNRSKIRNNYLLESFSAKLKSYILLHYREDNYKYIDYIIRIVKFFVFSVVYLILILSTSFDYDSLYIISYSVFGFMGFFIALVTLSYNRETLKNVEHDHYFRMLSENRNELLKQISLRRVNSAFFNWLIPFSLPLFLYSAIFTSFHFIVQYIFSMFIYYLVLFIFVFATQKTLFKVLRRTVFIGDMLIYFFSILVIGIPIILHIFILILSEIFGNQINPLLIHSLVSVIFIFVLWILKTFVYKSSFKYSATHTLLVGDKLIFKRNKVKQPNLFIRLFYGKDDFSNVLLTKDLLSFYRRDRRETFYIVFTSFISLVYSFFIVFTLQSGDSIISIIPLDNVFLSVIMIFFVITNYRYKDINWYSSEGLNLGLFKRLKYEPLKIYQVKVKFNSIILLPMILLYAISPLFLVFTINYQGVIYVLIRFIVIMLYALILLEYPLINDAKKTIIKKYKDLLFMRAGDLAMFIFFIQGIGLSVLLTYLSENTLFTEYSYVFWFVIGVLILSMVLVKVRFLYIRRSFK